MPDWTYQTVFKPLLFRLPPIVARNLALGAMGTLSHLPLGGKLIDFLGHMRPPLRLSRMYGNIRFRTPVGLGCGIDPLLTAPRTLERFGFGFLDVGPVTRLATTVKQSVQRTAADERLILPFPDENPGVDVVAKRLRRAKLSIPVIVRLPNDVAEAVMVMQRLDDLAHAFACTADVFDELDGLVSGSDAGGITLLILVHPAADGVLDEPVANAVASGKAGGLIIDGAARADGTREMGACAFRTAKDAVERWRTRLGESPLLIASGGIHEPAQALALIHAGANLVEVDSGLVFTGPGLPKRVNEALLHSDLQCQASKTQDAPMRPTQQAWFWALLMGVSMFGGGLLALVVAATRVVMPYDESMSGMTREQLASINDRLLHFMQHDRITLSGTMLAVGILYSALAWFGIRRGWHWAHRTVAVSAFAGFFSFFLFLAFGYFDPFHAFVTAILFQFLLLMISTAHSPLKISGPADLQNDWRWKLSQWGQLLFVAHGFAIVVAGIVISSIGSTTVFVPEDLEFMRTTADDLWGAHPQLVPLVAHDRATFGGMLISCGVGVLLPSLWGFRRGHRWLWQALMLAGNVAYLATIAVHWHVCYSSLKHLLPAYGGLAALWIGGLLTYPYLCQKDAPPGRTIPRTAAAGAQS